MFRPTTTDFRDLVLADWAKNGVHLKYDGLSQSWYIYKDGFYEQQVELDRGTSIRIKKLVEKTLESLGYQPSERTISEVVSKLSRHDDILIRQDNNISPNALPVGNGLLDLESLTLTTTGPETFFAKRSPVLYDPSATCPLFEQAIERMLPDRDMQLTLQEYMGYSLTGEASLQKALYIKGPGGTGKGTLMRVMEKLHGGTSNAGFATSMNISDFKDKSPALVNTLGRRLIYVSEVSKRADLEGFKKATGQDTLTVNPKYKEPFLTRIHAKIIITGNNWIHTGDDSTNNAIDRRLITLPFTINQAEVAYIPNIEVLLEQELSGILNWCIVGLHRLWANGNKFTTNGCAETRLEMLSNSNHVIDFLQDGYENDPSDKQPSQAFYDQYRAWGMMNGYPSMDIKEFQQAVLGAAHAMSWTDVDKKRRSAGWFMLGIARR